MKRLVWGTLILEIAAVPVLAVILALAMSGFGWGGDDSSATAEGPSSRTSSTTRRRRWMPTA